MHIASSCVPLRALLKQSGEAVCSVTADDLLSVALAPSVPCGHQVLVALTG